MCGISVLLDYAGGQNLISRLSAMHSVIPHRGPDGAGWLVSDIHNRVSRADNEPQLQLPDSLRVGFAFRRLKIRDLTDDAAQPMGSSDHRTWIVFNGEIYNFLEIRKELVKAGQVFRTQSDTEVVLRAYEHWGERCFAKLDGMWAIVILDTRRNRLVVSRDRFGIKPLYWTRDREGTLLFASEIKQLLAATDRNTQRYNQPLIEMYLRGQRYPVLEETFFEGICAIPPATWCAIDLEAPAEPRFHSYWSLANFTARHNRLSYDEARDRAEVLLSRTIAKHRSADVQVGALLSGGLDSSTLVALANLQGAPNLPTYSLGYREAAPSYCEMRYVDAMTQRDGIENHETTFDASWVAENTDRILWTLEEPPLAMPAFAQYRLFEFCAQHGATVILDGQGADEITAGYPYHQRAFIKGRLIRARPLAMLSELRAIAQRENRFSADLFADYFIRPRLQRRSSLPWVAHGGARANVAEFETARRDRGQDQSLVNQQLYFDVRWGNVKIVLGYGDRNAMAHSIEARVPYFDRAFVELLFSLPDEFKIGNGDRKRILRDIARQYVPPVITERADRMGYGTPDEEMIRGPLRCTINEAVHDPAFRESGWVNPAELLRFLSGFEQGRNQDHRALWRLFALSRFAQVFRSMPTRTTLN